MLATIHETTAMFKLIKLSTIQILRFSFLAFESKSFSRGYFMSPIFLLVSVSWVQDFFSWVFRGSKMFSRRYFVSPEFFFSWVFRRGRNFFRGYFVGPKLFSWIFRGSKFFCCRGKCFYSYGTIVSSFSAHPL